MRSVLLLVVFYDTQEQNVGFRFSNGPSSPAPAGAKKSIINIIEFGKLKLSKHFLIQYIEHSVRQHKVLAEA